jgi:mono/diheme cytochrome c family protein
MRIAFVTSLTCLSLALVDLGGGARAADAGATAEKAPAPAAVGAPKIDWAHASVAEKKKYMKSTVLPEMKKAFQEYDAKTYKKFTCATCHGDGATDGKFKMPNAKLPKLPTAQEGFMALQKKKPDAVKFMGTVVKPKMAGLLGLPEWTPQKMDGFGCYQCHTKEDAK